MGGECQHEGPLPAGVGTLVECTLHNTSLATIWCCSKAESRRHLWPEKMATQTEEEEARGFFPSPLGTREAVILHAGATLAAGGSRRASIKGITLGSRTLNGAPWILLLLHCQLKLVCPTTFESIWGPEAPRLHSAGRQTPPWMRAFKQRSIAGWQLGRRRLPTPRRQQRQPDVLLRRELHQRICAGTYCRLLQALGEGLLMASAIAGGVIQRGSAEFLSALLSKRKEAVMAAANLVLDPA
jgi:hypothetical protein